MSTAKAQRKPPRSYLEIARLEPTFGCPSELGGHDFAILQTWLEERDSVGFTVTCDGDRNWVVDVNVYGREWTHRLGELELEDVSRCPSFEAMLGAVLQVEAYERGELTFPDEPQA
jgi:hypothetical protein